MKDQGSRISSVRYLIAVLLLAGLLAVLFLTGTDRADASSARDGPSNATLSSPTLTSNLRTLQGAIADSLQSVKAVDSGAPEADRGFNSRLTMQQELPQITLEADPVAYVAGVGALVFTVTRTGDTAAELDLTINITQEQDWLEVTSFDVTIPAGESEQTLALFGDRFSSEVSESGNLTASVAPVDGYDTSDAAVVISVISQDGLAVVVRLDRVEYEVDEGAGTLGVVVVAVAHSSVSQVDSFFISISTQAGDATPQNHERDGDYRTLTDIEGFVSSDFQQENGSLDSTQHCFRYHRRRSRIRRR